MQLYKYFFKRQGPRDFFGYLFSIVAYAIVMFTLALNSVENCHDILTLIIMTLLYIPNVVSFFLPLCSILFLINWKRPTACELYSLNAPNKIIQFNVCSIMLNLITLIIGLGLGSLILFITFSQNMFFAIQNLPAFLLFGTAFMLGYFTYFFILELFSSIFNKVFAFFSLIFLSFVDKYLVTRFAQSFFFFHGIGQQSVLKIDLFTWLFEITLYAFFLYLSWRIFRYTIERSEIIE